MGSQQTRMFHVVMQLLRPWLGLLLLVGVATAQPSPGIPATQLMYLSPEEELKLSVALKRTYVPWPILKIGIGKSDRRWFGHIRFWVKPGAGRAQVLRQCRQAALVAFRLFEPLVQLDIDACPGDDTPKAKATPWFATSLYREAVFRTSLELPPQSWFELMGPVTLRDELHREGDPAESMAQSLLLEWNRK